MCIRDRLNPDPARPTVALYKNNTDGKGASYGTHENYLMRRETPFHDIIRHLTPFFVARQVIAGAGRVGIGQDSRVAGYQLTPVSYTHLAGDGRCAKSPNPAT